MAGDPDAFARPDTITLRLPPTSAGTVCVFINSQDGLYIAWASFRISAGLSRTVTLAGPRGHLGRLRRYRASELAMSATLGDCGDELATHAVPQWGIRAFQQDDVFLYVNSRDYTDVSWRGVDGGVLMAPCVETGNAYVVYSLACRIPMTTLRARTAVKIRQRRDGRTFEYDSVFVGGPR